MSGGKAVVVGFVGLLFSGCVAPFPPPAAGGSSDGGSTQSTGPTPSTTTDQDTTVGGTEGTTTSSGGSGSTTVEATDSSSGDPPTCDEDCGPNEACVEGACADACGGAWGEGGYGTCLDELGGVVPDTLCGAPDQHRCILYGDPIESTHCAAQHCMTACDCPAPPATGDATVTCGNITFPDRDNDCYLSCSAGETCPDGMTCRNGAVCVTEVTDVPMYGNCGNLASNCANGGVCATEDGHAVCVSQCLFAGQCDAEPAGAANEPECQNVVGPPSGEECHLPCNDDDDCPGAMACVSADLCMWPL